MKPAMAREVIACLPKERTLYRYFKDAYAVQLLTRHLRRRGETPVSALRASRFGRLLTKPVLEPVLARAGGNRLRAEQLNAVWPARYQDFVLTLGQWGRPQSYASDQVSRPGVNLVLQLNFSSRHDKYCKASCAGEVDLFQFSGHPISRHRHTLAWARIDLDFDTDEALIEEIQTDWLRYATWLRRRVEAALKNNERSFRYAGLELDTNAVKDYLAALADYEKLWSEAVLNAAINFIADEVGIGRIYYHSFSTGVVLKRIKNGAQSPKSLYTKLPKQFCFESICRAPEFIRADSRARRRLKAVKEPRWFYMTC